MAGETDRKLRNNRRNQLKYEEFAKTSMPNIKYCYICLQSVSTIARAKRKQTVMTSDFDAPSM